MNAMVRTLHHFGHDKYATEDGWMMRREHGETPNGNPIAGRWVLRDQRGEWVDFDQYRSDLAERNGMAFAFSPNMVVSGAAVAPRTPPPHCSAHDGGNK